MDFGSFKAFLFGLALALLFFLVLIFLNNSTKFIYINF